MRNVQPTPSLVPANQDVTVYLVVDDLGASGTAYIETDEANCDQDAVFEGFLTGQFNNPVRVVAFNTAEGWSRDASEDIARLVMDVARQRGKALSQIARLFYERHAGEEVPAKLVRD